MIVNIHTHSNLQSDYPFIRNLTFVEAEEIFESNEKGFFSVGFHPWNSNQISEELFKKIEKWSADNRFITIGECGLDKNSKFDLDIQMEVFKRQILLSETLQKPLIIHCVGSFNELFELKKQLKPKQRWIIHGFRGKPELAKQALTAGCSLSFGEHFNVESVRMTPVEKLFVETDESSVSIETIFARIAEIKGVDQKQLNAGELLLRNQIQ
jgi:TatD DNase family protein